MELNKQKVLVVDDEPANIKIVKYALRAVNVDIIEANSGVKAIAILREEQVDLVLLDLMMPGMNGFEVLDELSFMGILEDTSIIILTAIQKTKEKIKALEHGAIDYVIKPFVKEELLARVKIHLSLRRYQQERKQYSSTLEEKVRDRTRELKETQEVVAFSLARLAESRDPETGDHLERMSRYASILAKHLIGNPELDTEIDSNFAYIIEKVAVLHDIGKVGIPDSILLKPGKLTNEEFDLMKKHAQYGGDTLKDAMSKLEHPVQYLQIATNVAYYHHEKWNGKGYPSGLKGLDIPICARLVALADVYDALRSKRVYKPSFSHEKAKSIILEESGYHFQPLVVTAFLECEDKFIEVSKKFAPDSKK